MSYLSFSVDSCVDICHLSSYHRKFIDDHGCDFGSRKTMRVQQLHMVPERGFRSNLFPCKAMTSSAAEVQLAEIFHRIEAALASLRLRPASQRSSRSRGKPIL